MSKTPRRFHNFKRVTHKSMCAPAVRTVVVDVYAFEDGSSEVFFSPVVAVVNVTYEEWMKVTFGEHPIICQPANPTRPSDDSFVFQDIECDILVVTASRGEEGVTTNLVERDLLDDTDHSVNGVSRAVVCPWPEGEDAQRLATVIEQMKEEARDKRAKANVPSAGAATPEEQALPNQGDES